MAFNYQKICSKILEGLPERTKDVLLRRFGLKTGERETLESIGKSYGVTRERIRQIEAAGILKIKPKIKKAQGAFQYFNDSLENYGKLKKEDILLAVLGKKVFNPHVFFLLNLSDQFERFSENQELHSLWTIDSHSLDSAREVINDFYEKLERSQQPLGLKDYTPPRDINPKALFSYFEVSKMIEEGPEGKFGLKDWPEISPRGVKDKAYLVLKKEEKPLHFSEVAKKISSDTLVQTVHNELIRDPRFVLVGRGIYALAEWGYKPGTVKDIISDVLEKAEKPLVKEEILKKVLKQRLVKENTVLLNLSDKEHFLKNSRGKYILKNA
jgi:hypothetical protein